MKFNDFVIGRFEEFAQRCGYDTTVVCQTITDEGEYKRQSVRDAFAAFHAGFESSLDVLEKMRSALEAVQCFGSCGSTEDGTSVCFLVSEAIKASEQVRL